jgi:hypothetical protein
MVRDLFAHSTGNRSPKGTVISTVQAALNAAPGAQPVAVDGDFGGQTIAAVARYQCMHGLPATGILTDATWAKLMKAPMPGMFERCLQLTADFDSTSYTRPIGNFDGAGITWGITGFTLKHGELGRILGAIRDAHPGAIAQAFGYAQAELLMRMCGEPTPIAEKLAWADSISTGANKVGVIEPWKSAFKALGSHVGVQAIQNRWARDAYWRKAVDNANVLGMHEELDYALLYDVAVQNGGLGPHKLQSIANAFDVQCPATSEARRLIVSDIVAGTSLPHFQADVRSRKHGISMGHGHVHGSSYRLADWALLDGVKPSLPL